MSSLESGQTLLDPLKFWLNAAPPHQSLARNEIFLASMRFIVSIS